MRYDYDEDFPQYHPMICPVCGNEFNCRDLKNWVYKIYDNGYKKVCSYHCMREYEKKHERKTYNNVK